MSQQLLRGSGLPADAGRSTQSGDAALALLIRRFAGARQRCSATAKAADCEHYRHVSFGFESPRAAAVYMLENFGPIPPKHSIDRINPRRGYEPGNLRYATASEQSFNVRTARRFWK
jgi:hypothetical protein